ncbi:MAG: serine hydrolase [Actinobacteria bacterium]|nr:serine hydrolase [Actinomycetota bacterium]
MGAAVALGDDLRRARPGLTLDNWQCASNVKWSFQHLDAVVPTTPIVRGAGPAAALPPDPRWCTADVAAIVIPQPNGSELTVADVLAATDTDGWMVTRQGCVVAEEYCGEMTASTRHMLMSVSKSLVGAVAGALVDGQALQPDAPVSAYVPVLADTGYAGATVRHLLDMRSGVRFSEDYLDPASEVRLLEEAIDWTPRRREHGPRTMYDFLCTLTQNRPHGGPFEYRSGETDVLGWVCEAAARQPMPQLMSSVLWAPLGAAHDALIGIDSVGTGMFDGGICATLSDLVRFGCMLANHGVSLTGQRVLSAAWIDDTLRGGPDSREAFAASSTVTLMPDGMYRNQLWFPYAGSDVLLCLGIHGQLIYINRPAGVVAAKLSSWPEPQDAWKLFTTLRALDTIAVRVGFPFP